MAMTREQLERLDLDTLDRMAYGVAAGDRLTLSPKQIGIKYPGDLDNPQAKWDKGGMAWAKGVSLAEPVEVSVGQNGKYWLEDGHHRWFAAGKTGRRLTAEVVKVTGKPIEKILGTALHSSLVKREQKEKRNPSGQAPTLAELNSIPWSSMRDYPSTVYPHRAPILATASWTNEHGVSKQAQVLTNRTRTRWWLQIITVSGQLPNGQPTGSLSLFLTTTSKVKAGGWVEAVRKGMIGEPGEPERNPVYLGHQRPYKLRGGPSHYTAEMHDGTKYEIGEVILGDGLTGPKGWSWRRRDTGETGETRDNLKSVLADLDRREKQHTGRLGGAMKFVIFAQSGMAVGTVSAPDRDAALAKLSPTLSRFGVRTTQSLYLYPYLSANRELQWAADQGVQV